MTNRAIQPARRRLLSMLLGTAVLSPMARYANAVSARFPAVPDCMVTPAQTEGPFFIDHDLQRSDIRAGKKGAPLQLGLHVTLVNSNGSPSCTPLPKAVVDIWHCDAQGRYSSTAPADVGQDFLRGQQTTDTSGAVYFTSIFPGWYPGRAPHIHFKIRAPLTSQRGVEFTSQLYFPANIIDRVYREEPYRQREGRPPSNSEDWIYRRGGKDLLLELAPMRNGFAANFNIGLRSV